ncbi:MAG: hypothetical protein M9894_19525 [Planctomycetes bacterium]|nr:hypothetical protein [Planctomycetota bacterium]
MRHHVITLALVIVPWLALSAGPARAVTDDEVSAAVERGVQWLRSRQDQDGAFRDRWAGQNYKTGETALALLTLLKCGARPDDPAIDRGFNWLLAQPLQRVYEVSVAVMALEARYTPDEKASIASQDPLATQIRQRFQKIAPARDRDWLARAVEFLIAQQDRSGQWKYPGFGDPDVSNAQFAVLALKAARRMSVRVPKEVFLLTTNYLLEHQEAGGPEVPSFEVPAADQPIQGLHDRRARERERQAQRDRERRQSGGTRTREGESPSDGTRTRTPMRARGWGYRPGHGPRGSMTAAGVAILVIAKDELEETPGYAERLGPRLDQALRDGAAWLAQRFRADAHPGAEPDWLFYYLYTLERAGTLLALDRFGGRDWYQEGAQVILSKQHGDGKFVAGMSGETDGELAGSCLALLFLKRSTVPVIKRVRTGGDSYDQGGGGGGGPTISRRDDGLFDVTLSYQAGAGRRVALAGSFNGWNKDAALCEDPDGDGVYVVRLTLGPGRHTYKFVVDDHSWLADPKNPRGEPDGHGGQNSVLELN